MKHLMIVGAVLGGLSIGLLPALAQNWTATSAPTFYRLKNPAP
jgi:hypothetical protein